MRDYIALLRVGLGKDRFERRAAFGCAVARVLVDMQRPETVRAVIARRIAERRDLPAAMLSDKAAVVL